MEVVVHLLESYSSIDRQLPPAILAGIESELSYFIKGAQYSQAYQEGRWDGKKKLFSTVTRKFPTGLISRVIKFLKKEGYIVEVLDHRAKPLKVFDVPFDFKHTIRPFQLETVAKAIEASRGLIHVATGLGKTLTALKIAQELGTRSLFIVNTKEALEDTAAAADEYFGKKYVGVYGGSHKRSGIMLDIATAATAYSWFKRNPDRLIKEGYNCLFLDEVHRVGSDSWYTIALNINAFYKFGLTGTPYRTDNAEILLQAATGKTLVSFDTKFGQKEGFLVDSKVYFVRIDEPKTLLARLNKDEVYQYGIVENEHRNKAVVSIVKKHLNQTKLIVVEKIEHGELLLEEVKKVDPTAVFVSGSSKNRTQIKADFCDGTLKTVIATRIYNESANIPILEVVINAAGFKSGNQVIQRIGRALRPHIGKVGAVVYDFYDTFNNMLLSHAESRTGTIKKEGHSLEYLDYDLNTIGEDNLDVEEDFTFIFS